MYLKKSVDSVQFLMPGSTSLQSGVLVTSAHLAKGLEFDHVIVPHIDNENCHTEVDPSMLYIASTRAMHRLTLTHSLNLTGLIDP